MERDDYNELPVAGSLRRWERLGIASAATLRTAISRGELRASRPTARTIRLLRSDVIEWLRAHPVPTDEDEGQGLA